MKKICVKCSVEKDISCFSLYGPGEPRKEGLRRNTCSYCISKQDRLRRKANPDRDARYRTYQALYHQKNPWRARIKAYQHFDRCHKVPSVSAPQFQEILSRDKVCYYCEDDNTFALGLDRLDNNLGHSIDNVVLCCARCNNILGDLPNSAKQILKAPLKEIKEKGLLREWVIPTQRKKKL